MRTGLACALLLTLALGMAGATWAAEDKAGTAETPPAQTPAAAQAAPGMDLGTEDIRRDQDLIGRDLEHLDETTRLSIEALEKQIAAQNDRISDLSSGSDRVANIITLLAIFIALAATAVGFTAYFSASKQASDSADKWMRNHGAETLEPLLEKLSNEARRKIDQRIQAAEAEIKTLVRKAIKSTARMDELVIQFEESIKKGEIPKITPPDKVELDSAAEEAKAKPISEQTYQDWETQGIAAYLDENFEASAEAFDHAAHSEDASPVQSALALIYEGMAYRQAGLPEAAIAADDEVLRRFGDAEDPALHERVADALGGNSFSRIILAKRVWQSPGGEDEAREVLSQSLADADAGLEIDPEQAAIMGNKGYALFLLGREDEAEPVMRRALELGGEIMRDAELEDADIHPLPQDGAFKELIGRLWAEISDNDSDNNTED